MHFMRDQGLVAWPLSGSSRGLRLTGGGSFLGAEKETGSLSQAEATLLRREASLFF